MYSKLNYIRSKFKHTRLQFIASTTSPNTNKDLFMAPLSFNLKTKSKFGYIK